MNLFSLPKEKNGSSAGLSTVDRSTRDHSHHSHIAANWPVLIDCGAELNKRTNTHTDTQTHI